MANLLNMLRNAMQRRANYRGWVFEFAHPGVFVYNHPNSDVAVYFTPDYNEKGYIDLQATLDDQGVNLETGSVPFPIRTPAALFAAVKPYLDKYHPSKGKGRK